MSTVRMSYAELLRDPRWIAKRQRILERDGNACQECGSTRRLQAHHLYYEMDKDPWEYDDGVLRTLCDACHGQATDTLRAVRRTVGVLGNQSAQFVRGFVDALTVHQDFGGAIRPTSAAEWNGIARYWGVNYLELQAVADDDGYLTFDAMWELAARKKGAR